jgi:hypothetical protein
LTTEDRHGWRTAGKSIIHFRFALGGFMSQPTAVKKIFTSAIVAATAVAALSACAVEDTSKAGNDPANTGNTNAGTKSGKSKPSYTAAQENAIESAKTYLAMSGFSKTGLIQQLSSKAGEGFKRADAVFAVNHIKVDWNKEALESARAYLDMSSFSRSGLIQQLSSKAGDGFTPAQATFAANKLGL